VRRARESVKSDVVVDFVAFYPVDVRTATEIFVDVNAYVYVSSTAAYQQTKSLQIAEDRTPLHDCSPDQATDDSGETYGPRKAEGDRVVFDAARQGVNAMSVRPTAMYGPTTRRPDRTTGSTGSRHTTASSFRAKQTGCRSR